MSVFKSTCSGCILIHLEKTRHLVFSHTTSKKNKKPERDRFFPACTQKIYTSYNLQKEEKEKGDLKSQPWTNHSASDVQFGHVDFLHGRRDGSQMPQTDGLGSECISKPPKLKGRGSSLAAGAIDMIRKIIFSSTCQT